MRALEHFVIMANKCNSFIICEYFLDLKRIMMEYNCYMYQTVYCAKLELCTKDCKIDELCNDIHTLMETTQGDIHALMEKRDIQIQKLEMMSEFLIKETDNKVIEVEAKRKKQELVVLRIKNQPNQI